ncbi:uncharacterized protein LOC115887566 [Sitophilus oryzae]|uniref:Uncharacterized protein LOC115887566 n=1 Tax=Sitophilus oryzae TaxID=7048 RepID=A0A6J2YFY2_SITOR|nr:uncharacterized protein LOC115887566 [Sitophilus oryzae]
MHFLIVSVGLLTLCRACCGAAFAYCKYTDPNFDSCFKDSFQKAIKLLENDIPEYGLANLKVYKIPALSIQAGSGSVHLIQNYKNVELLGLSDATVISAHFDKDKKILSFSILIPNLIQRAEYEVNGKLMALPVVGHGPSELQLENVEMTTEVGLEEENREGLMYYKITSYKLDLKTSHLRSRFDNLFDGNKLLGDNINRVLNDEWQIIFNDVKSSTEAAYSTVLKDYVQTFFNHVPAKDLFYRVEIMIAVYNIIFLTILCYSDGAKINFCKSTKPDFNNCLKKSAEEVLVLLKEGIPEYDLPNLTVFKAPKITVQAGIGAVELIQHYENVEIYGLSEAIVKDVYFDKDKKIFGLTVTIPKFTLKADYSVDGKLLALPVVGSGPSLLEFYNLEMKNVLYLEEYTRDGTIYYKIKTYDLDLSTSKMNSRFDNMFNGNKLLGDNINKLLNDEWEIIFKDTKASTEKAYKEAIQPYIQKFLDKVPAAELF